MFFLALEERMGINSPAVGNLILFGRQISDLTLLPTGRKRKFAFFDTKPTPRPCAGLATRRLEIPGQELFGEGGVPGC